MVVRPTQSRGGVKGETSSLFLFPLRSPEAAPLVGFGATPQLLVGRPFQRKPPAKGAGSEASLPVTLRSRRSAPKLLYPTSMQCRAKWARPDCLTSDHSWSFPQAGVSPLQRRNPCLRERPAMVGSQAIWSRPFGATLHRCWVEQLGGAPAGAQSYWQGRFAACTLCWRLPLEWSPDQ